MEHQYADAETHRRFLEDLAASQLAVERVATWFRSRGFDTEIPPHSEAPRHADWRQHADQGDLFVYRRDQPGAIPRCYRIEVKQLTAVFTCQEDWPFGSRFIVCAKHTWDHASPKPHQYVYLNAAGDHVALLLGSTHPRWTTDEVLNRKDNRVQTFYLAPLPDVWFGALSLTR